MWPPLAPVETRATQQATGFARVCCIEAGDIQADRGELSVTGIGDHATVAAKLDEAVAHQRIGNCNAKLPGQVIIAGPARPQRLILGSDDQTTGRPVETSPPPA